MNEESAMVKNTRDAVTAARLVNEHINSFSLSKWNKLGDNGQRAWCWARWNVAEIAERKQLELAAECAPWFEAPK